jgi:hypothetical protein
MIRCAFVLFLAGYAIASAQSSRTILVKPADATLKEEFSGITGLRELSDGRTLISDLRENRLILADLRTGKTVTVGRPGDGPGEFRRVSTLFSIGGDSTLMPDGGYLGRWLLLDEARVASTLAADANPVGDKYATLKGVDAAGRVLVAVLIHGPEQASRAVDSLLLININRATRRADTVARLRSHFPKGAQAFGETVAWRPGAATSGAGWLMDEAVLFPDGWIAIVRRAAYRVEWRSPRGEVITRTIRSSAQEGTDPKGEAAESLAKRNASRFDGMLPSVLAVPDGRLMVLRPATDNSARILYDMVDRNGALVGTLTFGDNERVVGFGARSLYVTTINEDGIQRLRRHPWP